MCGGRVVKATSENPIRVTDGILKGHQTPKYCTVTEFENCGDLSLWQLFYLETIVR